MLRRTTRNSAAMSSLFLPAVSSWLPILPNRMYPFGGSASPENVFVTEVTEDAVYYCAYPHYGPSRRESKSTFHALVKSALGAKIKQLEPYIGGQLDYGWMAPIVQHYKNLLAGENTLPEEDQTDYEQLKVIARQNPSYVPTGDRDDLYYIMEQYGSTSLGNEDGYAYTVTTRKQFKELVQEKALLLVSVEVGNRFEW
jgi:hypothetical protein